MEVARQYDFIFFGGNGKVASFALSLRVGKAPGTEKTKENERLKRCGSVSREKRPKKRGKKGKTAAIKTVLTKKTRDSVAF